MEKIGNDYKKYLKFEPEMEEIDRLQKYFERAIAILSTFKPNQLTFQHKPKIWKNTVFVKQKGKDYFYIRSKLDSLVSMFPAKGELSKSKFFLSGKISRLNVIMDIFCVLIFCVGIFLYAILYAFFVRVFNANNFLRAICCNRFLFQTFIF